MPHVLSRIEKTKAFRLASKAAATRKYATMPAIFCQIAQPKTSYLLVPGVSSERRQYIPIGFMNPNIIANNLVFVIPDAELFHFGVMSSTMHMAWVRYTCGRLESRYRYSKDIVYNNYPWPTLKDERQREAIEEAAQGTLDARAAFPDTTLAALYDPVTMPPKLLKAHQALDRAVDKAYGKRKFNSDAERVAFLFELYQKYTTLLPAAEKPKRGRRKSN